jgi:hypothetical protein
MVACSLARGQMADEGLHTAQALRLPNTAPHR